MTYLHCLQHSLFEHLFNLYSESILAVITDNIAHSRFKYSYEARHSISFKLPTQFLVIFLYITFVTYVTVQSCYHLFL